MDTPTKPCPFCAETLIAQDPKRDETHFKECKGIEALCAQIAKIFLPGESQTP